MIGFGPSLLALIVTLLPFAGQPLTAGSDSARFTVAVIGGPGQKIHLRALNVPSGYVASFCTNRVCAPFRVTFWLPPSGHQSIELQLIKNVAGASTPKRVTVTANGAQVTSIPFHQAGR